MKILYLVIDGEMTGGNIICLKIIEEALKRGFEAIVNSPTEGKFTGILRAKGIRIYNIDTRRSFRLDSAFKLARVVREEGVDIIHSHTPLPGTIISRIAAKLSNVPVINHEHGLAPLNFHPLIKSYQLFLHRVTAKLANCKVIAVSANTREGLILRNIPQEKIQVVYNGLSAETAVNLKPREEILRNFGLSPGCFIVGQVGRLDEKKGQHILIEAAGKVLKTLPDVIFLIVGEDFQNGVYRKKLEALAGKLNISRNIIFTGYRDDIADLMNAFDIFVLPTLQEGFPLVILEAMAAKKPVITTAVGGNPEIVVDTLTGTFVPSDDADKLAQAIIYHIRNPEISKSMGENGYLRLKQRFALDGMLEEIMALYRQALANRSTSANRFNSLIKNIFRFASRFLISQKNIERFRKNYRADKILVISLTHLGDIVLLSPFLGNLRLNYPKARIDILLKEQVSEILKYSPHVDNRIIYNAKWVTNRKGDGFLKTWRLIRRLRHARYDLCFVTHPHVFSNMIAWLAGIPERIGYSDGDGFLNIPVKREEGIRHARDISLNLLKYLDLKIESVEPRVFLGPEDIAFAENLRKELSISETPSQLLVGIHPGAGRRERIWLPERYAQVISYLVDRHKARILLFAGTQEADIAGKIMDFIPGYKPMVVNLCAKTTVRQMAGLMNMCTVILANDAGPMHIASALGKPTVALFAATPDHWPKVWGPLSTGSKVVSQAEGKVGMAQDIKVEDVIRAIETTLARRI